MSQPSKSRRTSWWRSAACSRSSLTAVRPSGVTRLHRAQRKAPSRFRQRMPVRHAQLRVRSARARPRCFSFIRLGNRRCAPDRCRVRHEADRPLRARPCRSGRPSRRSRDAQSARRTGRHKLNTAQKSCPSGDFISERQLFSSIQCLCETSASRQLICTAPPRPARPPRATSAHPARAGLRCRGSEARCSSPP